MIRMVIEFTIVMAIIGALPSIWKTVMDSTKKVFLLVNDGIRKVFRLDEEEKKTEPEKVTQET